MLCFFKVAQKSLLLQYPGAVQRVEMADGQLQIFWSDHEALTFVPTK